MNEHYFYVGGFNLQAVFAYLCGIALPFPGFVGTLGPHVSTAATDLGRLGWLLSFSISFVVYYLLCLIWPTRNQKLIRQMGLRWEEQADINDAREADESGEEEIDAIEPGVETVQYGEAISKNY